MCYYTARSRPAACRKLVAERDALRVALGDIEYFVLHWNGISQDTKTEIIKRIHQVDEIDIDYLMNEGVHKVNA